MKNKKLLIVFSLLIVATFGLVSQKVDVAQAMEGVVIEDTTFPVTEQLDEYSNLIMLNKDSFSLEGEYYTKEISGGDYSKLYVYPKEETDILINDEVTSLEENIIMEMNVEGFETLKIQVPKNSLNNLEIGVTFLDSQEEAKASYPDNISYELTYGNREELGKVYYLSLSSTDGSSLKLPYSKDMMSLNQAYVDSISTIDDEYILFSNLTEEMTPQLSFTVDEEFDLPFKSVYEIISSDFSAQNYQLRASSVRCHHDSDHDWDRPEPDCSEVEAKKSYSDEDGDHTIEPNEDETYTITVTNESDYYGGHYDGGYDGYHYGGCDGYYDGCGGYYDSSVQITVIDNLVAQSQNWYLVYDLSDTSSIDVEVTGATPSPANPTLADLMGRGVSFELDEDDEVSLSFTLHTQPTIPEDLNNDTLIDNYLTNVATVKVEDKKILRPSVTVPIIRPVAAEYDLDKNVVNLSGNNPAQAGDTLEYSIEFSTNQTGILVKFGDTLTDPNLNTSSIVSGSLTKDGIVIPTSEYTVHYDTTLNTYVLELKDTLEADAEYIYTFEINVSDPIVANEENKITNTVKDLTTSNSFGEATAEIELEEYTASLTKTVEDSNGNLVAEPGEYLTYTVEINANEREFILIDDIDENLDISTIDFISLQKDGVDLDSTSYTISIDAATRKVTVNITDVDSAAVYTIKYAIKVTKPLANDEKSMIINHILEDNSDLEASVDIPLINVQNNAIFKTVSDDSDDGKAQPGERLEYSIEYQAAEDKDFIIIEDKLEDPNLVNIPSNIRIFEDSTLLTEGINYTFLPNNKVYIEGVDGIKEGSDYMVIFDINVQNPIVDTTDLIIRNTATEITEDISDSANIEIINEKILEEASISKTVVESSTEGTSDFDNQVDIGEYLHYDIIFSSNVSSTRYFVDKLDENLDIETVTNLSIEVDSVPLTNTEYGYIENTTNNVLVIEYPEYEKDTEVRISYDVQLKNPLVDADSGEVINEVSEVMSDIENNVGIPLGDTAAPKTSKSTEDVSGVLANSVNLFANRESTQAMPSFFFEG